MKKIFKLSLPIGMLILLFAFCHASERASGAAKSTSIGIEKQNGIEQVGPPWYNEAWQYRQPVIISNSGAPLSYYQVLVKLTSDNFNFNRAKADGSDLRFTDSSGKNTISYWIESWDKQNQLAYLWVLVSNLSPEPYDTTIYLYYNNPTASPQSNGLSTFDSFDDNWSQFTGVGVNIVEKAQSSVSAKEVESLFSWFPISGSPTVESESGNLILVLVDGKGVKSTSPYKYQAVGFRANFGLGGEHERGGFLNVDNGQGTMIGDCLLYPGTLSLINHATNENCKELLPKDDWQNAFYVYEVRWRASQSIGEVDHGPSSAISTDEVPSNDLQVTLYSYPGSKATMKVDWVYVRQYHNPEPVATTNKNDEQGLVELGINAIDAPDPLRPGTQLTYQLTISNTSSINAPGVVVTDTLPGNVQIGLISSSQGNCGTGSIIRCDLGMIPANSTANITIAVTPALSGIITNNAIVGSPGYELDLSNNTSQQETLVDSIPPTVYWEKPVNTGQNYFTNGGPVALEASAADINDQVAWVEFRLWDHIGSSWISVGLDNTYPYQVQFNSDMLAPNQIYQMFVLAADRAGNLSNPTDPLHPSVIYIMRKLLFYLELPLIIR